MVCEQTIHGETAWLIEGQQEGAEYWSAMTDAIGKMFIPCLIATFSMYGTVPYLAM